MNLARDLSLPKALAPYAPYRALAPQTGTYRHYLTCFRTIFDTLYEIDGELAQHFFVGFLPWWCSKNFDPRSYTLACIALYRHDCIFSLPEKSDLQSLEHLEPVRHLRQSQRIVERIEEKDLRVLYAALSHLEEATTL